MEQIVVVTDNARSVVEAKKALLDKIEQGENFGITFKGLSQRTLSQNALLHVWLRSYASHLLRKKLDLVSEREVGYMKMTAKRRCYADTSWGWLIEHRQDLITKESSKGLTSSKKWSKGELFNFMEWLQAYAANDDLILESSGEYEALRNDQQ